jgi:hypothetical protein
MNLGQLILLNGGLGTPKPMRNLGRLRKRAVSGLFITVKPADFQPVKPLLGAGQRIETARGSRNWRRKAGAICVWFFGGLLAVMLLAGGFGMLQIQHAREQRQLAQQLKKYEAALKQSVWARQELHAQYVFHLSQEQRQPEVRTVSTAPVRKKTATRI